MRGEVRGRAGSTAEPPLQAGRRLRFQPIVAPLPRRREQLPKALAAAPGSARPARGTAAAAGRVCQHRAHGPGPEPARGLPGVRPGPARGRPVHPGTLPAGSHSHTRAHGHAERLWPSSLLAPAAPRMGPAVSRGSAAGSPAAATVCNARFPWQVVSLADLRQEICCWS